MGEAPDSMQLKEATEIALRAHGAAVNDCFEGGGLLVEGYNCGLTDERLRRVLEAVHGGSAYPEPSEVGDRTWQIAWE